MVFLLFPILYADSENGFVLGFLTLMTLNTMWLSLHLVGYILILGSMYFAIQGIVGFRNRKKQMTRIRVLQSLLIIVLLWMASLAYAASKSNLDWKFGFVVMIPIVSIVLSALAYRGVKKDENLIRSVDRLR